MNGDIAIGDLPVGPHSGTDMVGEDGLGGGVGNDVGIIGDVVVDEMDENDCDDVAERGDLAGVLDLDDDLDEVDGDDKVDDDDDDDDFEEDERLVLGGDVDNWS